MNQTNQNELISSSLLKWVSSLTNNQIASFDQLSTGEFYLELLSSAHEFKLTKPIKSPSSNEQSALTLATRVSNIKTIGDSVIKYYQTHLMTDISQMKINYVELCMGSVEQAIKLFSLVVGVFVEQNAEMFKRFESALEKLHPDDQYIVKALLQNTKSIGQSIVLSEQPSLQQKMLAKLQAYEDKIDSIEQQNKDLRLQLDQEKHSRQAIQTDFKDLKAERSKLIQKTELFEVLNSRLESQNSSLLLQNQSLLRKLESQKRHHDQTNSKTHQKLSSLQKQFQLIDSMKLKIEQLKTINSDLKQQLSQQIQTSKNQQTKFNLIKENNQILQDNLRKTQTKLSEVELAYQELKFNHEDNSAFKPKHKINESPAYKFSNNSQMSSLKYRVRDRLGSQIKDQLPDYQMIHSIMVRKNSKQSQINSGQLHFANSSLVNVQNLMLSTFDHNLSNFVINQIGNPNIKDIEDVSEFDGNSICPAKINQDPAKINQDPAKINQNDEELDRSLILEDEEVEKKPNKVSRIKIVDLKQNQTNEEETFQLKQKNLYLQRQNELLKLQLKKYDNLRRRNEARTEEFKKKLARVRQLEPISQINSSYQKMKENMSLNIPQKEQNINQESKKKQIPASKPISGKQYPFYQMTLN